MFALQILDPTDKQLFSDKQPASEFVLFCNRKAVVAYDPQSVAGDVSCEAEQPKQFYYPQRASEDRGLDWRLAREQAEGARNRQPKPNQVVFHPSPDCRPAKLALSAA